MSVEGTQSNTSATAAAALSAINSAPNVSLEAHASNQATEAESAESAQSSESESAEQDSNIATAVKESEEEAKLASKFATLSRKEKQIREREAQLDRKMQMLEEKLSKFESLSTPAMQPEPTKVPEIPLEVRLKKNPLETLSELGLNFETLTNLALNGGKLTPEMQLELMKQELEEKYNNGYDSLRKELEKRDTEKQEQEFEIAVKTFKRELNTFIDKSEDYELIRANNAADLVFEVIETHYNQTGEIIDNKQAADAVESELMLEAEKLFNLNKLKSKFAPPVKAPEPKQELKKVQTLSNNQSSGSQISRRPLTRDESLAEAARLLKWKD